MPLLLNRPTPFKINDRVSVTLIHGTSATSRTAIGTVCMKKMAPVNRALPEGDQTDHIYVSFDDAAVNVYADWLQRGSMILCRIPEDDNEGPFCDNLEYVIDTIRRSNDGTVESMEVYSYSGFRQIKTIALQDIRAMLIWLVAYDMKLST